MTRRFTSELLPIIGPQEDIPAPDMATNEQTMAWMMDTYSMQIGLRRAGDRHRQADLARRLALPPRGDGRRRRDGDRARVPAARLGARRAALRRPGLRQRRRDRGGRARRPRARRCIAVSDVSGGVYDEDGLDLAALRRWPSEHGSLDGLARASTRSRTRSCSSCPCDILVLAAREDQVTARTPTGIQARMVAEGANGPTSIEADAILAERGIPVLPDVLTNAGGVTVSYFEWVQDLGRLFWDRDEIRAKLAEQARRRLRPRLGRSPRSSELTLRSAALVAGIREVGGALDGARASTREPRRVRDAMIADPQTLEARRDGAGGGRAARPARGARGARRPTTAASSASSRARRWCARSSRPGATRGATALGRRSPSRRTSRSIRRCRSTRRSA